MKKRILTVILASSVLAAVAVMVLLPRGRRPRMNGASARPAIESVTANPDAIADVETSRESMMPLSTKFELVKTDSPIVEEVIWNRFRGPNGTGVSLDTTIPTEWSDTKNLRWKTKLPGSGASSPVLTKAHAFVTSYSGYGEEGQLGDIKQLKRHLSCIDRSTGAIVWTRSVNNEQREDPYQGMGVPEHGYATNTPATDGKSVYAFLGKSGVHAFDLNGNPLWNVSVGTESGNRGWGSAASLIVYGDLLIVNASEESQAIVALEKATGKVAWKAEASTLESTYGTPAIVKISDTRDDLVIAVPGEVWGMNPLTGKLAWFAETSLTDNLSPSVVIDGKTIYAFGGYRSSGSLAMQAGGKGDVSKSNILWTGRNSSYVASPVLLDRRLYWIDDRGMYYCINAETGELIHKSRTPGIDTRGRPVYASPVAINGKVYAQTRTSGVLVINPSDKLDIVAQNTFDSDTTEFNATPAIDAGQLFLRSNSHLYCVTREDKSK
ncbi:MAG: PQQ-binding-like beta-propeller repeat protein [Planctomycetota bacterium]|nr:PQQ-binding-like beta-propeller repeat protein [Planctomycetota bacterium]